MTEPISNALLFRDPILDRKQEIAGYHLSLRSDDATGKLRPRHELGAALIGAYSELGLQSALGKAVAFIGIDADLLPDDLVDFLPIDAVVIELLLDGPPDPATLARCRHLRERGHQLALTAYRGIEERSRPLLPLVGVVKIDATAARPGELADLAGSLRNLPIRLLAEGVDTREQMERCRSVGFELFQGRYFAQPEIVSGRRLSASQATLIRLINLVGRDADSARIEDAFKHEPALTLNLLRIVNSVGYRGGRLGQPVTSLRHAITLFGRRPLQRWLSLLLLAPAGATDPARAPLLQVAALRGRMMELLVQSGSSRSPDRAPDLAFLTGILSMMPAALGLPIDEILDQIAVDGEVRSALCEHRGLLGSVLALLECFDSDDAPCCDRMLSQLPGHPDRHTLNTCLGAALRWLNAGSE